MKDSLLKAYSRRTFIGSGLFALAGLASRRCFAEKISHIYPPSWVSDAHEVLRNIKPVSFSPLVITLVHRNDDAQVRIQGMIDILASQGGGTLRLSAGLWRVGGPLRLHSNIHLQIPRGVVLEFTGDRDAYLPLVKTRWEGTDLYGYSPCIYAADCSNVAITGQGAIRFDCAGDMVRWRDEQTEAQATLRQMGDSGVPLAKRIFGSGSFLRPSFIQFINCSRVLVEGVSIGPTIFWGLHMLYSEHITIRNAKFESHTVNTDGIDIDSSKLVHIEGCHFRTGDDCIAIKSGRDLDGRTVAKPSEDVVIRNCFVERSGSNALAIGSEMSGGVRRVYLIQCRIQEAAGIITIKSNLDRGGVVEDVFVWDVKADRCGTGIKITNSYHGYRGGKHPPSFRDITIETIAIREAKRAIDLADVLKGRVARVLLQDIVVDKAYEPSRISDSDGYILRRVTVG